MDIKVQNKTLCPRYSALLVKNIVIKNSSKKIQSRLSACGLRSINNIVDITNYLMLETGQPMHAFDADKIDSIVVRNAKNNEQITTLDNQEKVLNSNILVIADSKDALAIAGIKGGKKAEITKNTKNIILEAANFDALAIRNASKLIGLKTDASHRFECGVDISLPPVALKQAFRLIKKSSQNAIIAKKYDIFVSVKNKRSAIHFDFEKYLNGSLIKKSLAKKILTHLGFDVRNNNVIPPLWRYDISIPEDILEEILRIYGYENIPSIAPKVILSMPAQDSLAVIRRKARDALVNIGFSEVMHYSLSVGRKESHLLIRGQNKSLNKMQDAIANVVNSLESNLRNFEEVRIFEIAKAYYKNKEKQFLIGICPDFFEAKGAIESVFNKMRVNGLQFSESSKQLNKRTNILSDINVNKTKIGFIAEIPNNNYYGLFVIDLNVLVLQNTVEFKYEPISKFPETVRDLSVLVGMKTKVSAVLDVIYRAGKDLIADVSLFDWYEGKNLPAGKKSLAFRVIYQSMDKTLSSEQVNKLHYKIMSAIEKQIKDAKVRK